MAETIVCGRCGARSWVGAATCYACGQSLTPGWQPPVAPGQPPAMSYAPVPTAAPVAPGQPMPYAPVPPVVPGPPPMPYAPVPPAFGGPGPYGDGAPPAGYNAPGPYTAGVARPTGINVLIVVEIVIAIVGLLVANDLFYWADWRFTYDGGLSGGLDAALGVAYVATSIAVFTVASGLWRMQRWAWTSAIILSVVLLGLIIFSVVEWEISGLDIIGVCAHLSVLAYLNTNPVRRLFGMSPVGFLQGPN